MLKYTKGSYLGKNILRYLVLLLVLSYSTLTYAHKWFPARCCTLGYDCNPVPCEELLEDNNGGVKYKAYVFFKDKVLPSQDKNCYACIRHNYPLCVFIQQGS